MPVVSARTVSRTSASLRSRVPRMYSIPRASSSASVRALIMPRSATTQIRPIQKRARRRSITGSSAWTSVAVSGQVSEGTAVAVEDHADHHLFQFRPVVLGLAAPPERPATLAVEVEGGGTEEHQVEIVEQVASSREQPLLHQVLDRPRRPGASLLVGQLLTQPGDRPVQVVQVDAVEPGNPVALQPLVAGPVGAGDAQPVQHAGEDRPLHRELELALCQQPLDHRLAAGLAPQTRENQRRADAPAIDQKRIAIAQGGQHQGGFGQAGTGLQQLIELASVQPILRPPQRGDDMLPNGAAIAAALDDLQIRAPTNGFAAEETCGPRLMHYANAPDTSLCQCILCLSRGTTFLANFRSKLPENRRNPPFPFRKRRQNC